jgi:hypothetical protein
MTRAIDLVSRRLLRDYAGWGFKLETLGKRIRLNTPISNSQQRTWDDLVALISKLQWIGEEAEARELELKLRAEATRLELQLRESPRLRRLLSAPHSIFHETD